MAGYILVDIKTKKTVGICIVIALLLFAVGIIIGYHAGRPSSDGANIVSNYATVVDAIKSSCSRMKFPTPKAKTYFRRYLERHNEKNICVNDVKSCLNFGLPRNYIAYHLNGKTITIDGKLDEGAWAEVPWSENFVDIRSDVFPKPYLDSKFKIRWDNERLYIGAYMEEKDLWATYDTHDSKVFRENALDILMDVDGSLFNYKQIQINVLGTVMDQVLFKSPHDGGSTVKEWSANFSKSVHFEGTVNQPGDIDKFWSVEISLTFAALAERSTRTQPVPRDNEAWFMQFGRAEYKLNVTDDGTYRKQPNSKPDWWAWQPCDAVNLQLQDRWGLVQFKRDVTDKKFSFERWHIYKALFDTLTAMKLYIAANSKRTDQIEELDVPPYLMSQTCTDVPKISVNRNVNFNITVKSMYLANVTAHILSDRYVIFE